MGLLAAQNTPVKTSARTTMPTPSHTGLIIRSPVTCSTYTRMPPMAKYMQAITQNVRHGSAANSARAASLADDPWPVFATAATAASPPGATWPPWPAIETPVPGAPWLAPQAAAPLAPPQRPDAPPAVTSSAETTGSKLARATTTTRGANAESPDSSSKTA